VRVSTRSKDERVDVCGICAEFGGGGHRMAAGARLEGPLAAARDRVLAVAGAAVREAGIEPFSDQ
jgi:phosphoesterase RecJ-like protein